MESINQVIDIVRLNVYMASIDLKDALYSIIYIQNIKIISNFLFYQKNINTHTCRMVMGQSCASLQKYPKSSFYTYKVKGLYQWFLLMIDTYRVILMNHVSTTLKAQLNYCCI